MHPKVKALYDAHPEIDRPLSVIDEVERKFLNKTKNFDSVITFDQLWRSRKGGIRAIEYIWYLKRTTSRDHKGNKAAFVKPEGKWDMPIFNYENGENDDGESRVVGVQTWEEMFDIEFSKEKLQEFFNSGMITEKTQFCIDAGARSYGGFTYEMFLERDFDDLVYFGQNAKFPTQEEKAILSGPPSKRMGLIKNA